MPSGSAVIAPKSMPLLTQRRRDRRGRCSAPAAHGARARIARRSRGDLVGEHLLEPEAEEVRRVAAVGPRDDVAADAGGAARPAVAAAQLSDEAGADRERRR